MVRQGPGASRIESLTFDEGTDRMRIGERMKLKTALALVLSVSVLSGCTSEQPASETPPVGQSDTGAPQNEAEFALPDQLDATLSESDRPSSIDSFKAEFQRRFEDDMYSPFIDLAFWGETADDRKREYLEGVRATFTMPTQSGRATLRSPDDIEMQTLADYGDYAYFPSEGEDSIRLAPPATHVMGITAHFNDSLNVTNYFAVGEMDGKFYFCTIASE
jgi:hypothetical protein